MRSGTVCGQSASAPSGLLHRYDPTTNTWIARKTAPHAHRYPAAGVIDGKLYVVGGNNGSSASATLDVYDPVTNTWATKASVPTARLGGAAGAVLGGELYVIGGRNAAGDYIATVEAYSPATNTWEARTPLPSPRSGLGAVASNGVISAVGRSRQLEAARHIRGVSAVESDGGVSAPGPGQAFGSSPGGARAGATAPAFFFGLGLPGSLPGGQFLLDWGMPCSRGR